MEKRIEKKDWIEFEVTYIDWVEIMRSRNINI